MATFARAMLYHTLSDTAFQRLSIACNGLCHFLIYLQSPGKSLHVPLVETVGPFHLFGFNDDYLASGTSLAWSRYSAIFVKWINELIQVNFSEMDTNHKLKVLLRKGTDHLSKDWGCVNCHVVEMGETE